MSKRQLTLEDMFTRSKKLKVDKTAELPCVIDGENILDISDIAIGNVNFEVDADSNSFITTNHDNTETIEHSHVVQLEVPQNTSTPSVVPPRPEYPDVWDVETSLFYQKKYSWLLMKDGKLGCGICKQVSGMQVHAAKGVKISEEWKNCHIDYYGPNIAKQKHSLVKKIGTHKASQAHISCEEILLEAEKKTLENATDAGFQKSVETTESVFRTAYNIAKNNRPYVEFEELIDLQVANGAKMGRVLHSVSTCKEIISHISKDMKQSICKAIINNRSKIVIFIDESTPLNDKNTVIVYLKSSIDNIIDPIIFFLDVFEIVDGTANGIVISLLACLLKHGFTQEILSETLIQFVSDGASLMLGHVNGVATRLKVLFPNIILWHCLNHRIEIALSQALESMNVKNNFEMFLNSIYSMYSMSPKCLRELRLCASELEVTVVKIGKVFSVRWVASTFNSMHAVCKNFEALVKHFETASNDSTRSKADNAKFRGFKNVITSENFVYNLAVMLDVLHELKDLSILLQKRDMSIMDAHNLMLHYIKRIQSLKDKKNSNTTDSVETNESSFTTDNNNLNVGKYEKEVLNLSETLKYKNICINKGGVQKKINKNLFIENVTDQLNLKLFTTCSNKANTEVQTNRAEEYSFIIRACSLLDSTNLLDSDDPKYGEEDICKLSEMFKIDVEASRLGFVQYKAIAQRTVPNSLFLLKNTVKLLSTSNAECERGFSILNIIVSDLRSRLTTDHMSDLLFISIVGPPVNEWNPKKYVKTWLRKGRRSANSLSCMARNTATKPNYYEPMWKYF